MANGRAAALEAHDPLAGEAYLAIGEVVGRAASARILLAAPMSLAEIEAVAGGAIETADEIAFDRASASLRARRRRRLGALTLVEQTLAVPADEASATALARGVLTLGLGRLPWSRALTQWRDRVMLPPARRGRRLAGPLGRARSPRIPNGSRRSLSARRGSTRSAPDDLANALHALLPWDLARRLDAEAPTHFEAPTGTAAPIDYEAEGGPSIALRVQELFGLAEHPAVAGGKIPLTLHLLSPAHRPIQITRDLPGFWRGSWAAVRSDLRGRYPRHFWPEDPASAAPTARAKPRGT